MVRKENKEQKIYKSLDDKFVDLYLRKENETIEEAKARIKKEQEEIKNKKE